MSDAIDRAGTLAVARAVLADDSATHMRRSWAHDVIAWLERGDAAAAQRLGVAA